MGRLFLIAMMTESPDCYYMHQALRLARRAASRGEAPIGALVVYEGRIIARGWNTREHTQQVTGHAEMMALHKASKKLGSWRLEGCCLYVTLEPCFMCAGAILQARIPRVVYGATDPKGGAVTSLARIWETPGLNHRVEVVGGILADESAWLLRSFFQSLRQKRREARSHATVPLTPPVAEGACHDGLS